MNVVSEKEIFLPKIFFHNSTISTVLQTLKYLNKFIIYYFNDILIYFKDWKKYK